MARHALEITLTRPATPAELARASQALPLAANHDTTRLMTVIKARNPGRALNRARRRLEGLLPLDCLSTHYPDQAGQVLLSVAFSPAAAAAIRHAAEHEGQEPSLFVAQVIRRALADHARRQAADLEHALSELLTRTSPDRLVAAVGRTLTHTTGEPAC
ncbi:hypothetical protein [Streptomyces sp. NBC_01716]|uniref:hypothetical protein n=1 Tax=Streptomyces sp. NBC_01716 TaxID=2975917 RepID=UPI002E35C86E|nr:hypothetical protein [Streptomyces sp. NBC_01716]